MNTLLLIRRTILFLAITAICATHHVAAQHTHHPQQDESTITLGQALGGFRHYIKNLVAKNHLPHTPEQQAHDLNITELELVDVATGPGPNDLIPIEAVIDLKYNYKQYLQSLYPHNFLTIVTEEGNVSRRLAKDRIKAEILPLLPKQNRNQKPIITWRQVKQEFVNHQLDRATFIDDNGIPVITEDDLNQILDDTRAWLHRQQPKQLATIKPKGIITRVQKFSHQ